MDVNFEAIFNWVSIYSVKIVAALLVFVIGRVLSRWFADMIGKLLEKNRVDVTLVRFLVNIFYYTFLVVVLTAAASQLGINTASFLTIIGTAGLAVGLALKDSLANFAAGVMLVLFRPFRVGDVITAAGVTGKVEEIALFNTMVCTGDNQQIFVPNSKIAGDIITNINAKPTRRIDLVMGISYTDDIDRAREVMRREIAEDSRILTDPAPTVAVAELGASSVDFVVRPWVKTEDYWSVRFDLTEKIKKAFDREGISIPYPQQDVHLFVEKQGAAPE